MVLGLKDAKGIGWYTEATPIPAQFSDYMNEALLSVSDALPDIVAGTAAARDAYWGAPATGAAQLALQARGARTIRTDKGWTEQYFALYNVSTNPGGAPAAGWYPILGRLPKVRGTKTTAQSTSAAIGTSVAISWDQETYDVGGMHDPAVNPSRYTFPAPGVYVVHARSRWNHASAQSTAQIYRGGVAIPEASGYDTGTAARHALVDISTTLQVTAGEYVELFMRSDTASVPLIVANCFIEAFLLSP